MSITQKAAISVSQLNFFVKSLFDADLRLADVVICGEISNFSGHYKSGHLYFTLKDETASVKAVMFSRNAASLRFRPENGMKVIVRGRVSVYERDGIYQVYAEDMQPDGIGALTIAYEQLKSKLEKEGLFSPQYKKNIPKYPQRIGVITSPTGAAVQDILNILARRWPLANVIFTPVSVQGAYAADEIRQALAAMDEKADCDVIIVGRGGGSIEDLWSFNDELLVRAIFRCKTPVISAVGHETDFTLCDFVSDLRAPTPSAAAELATPDRNVEIQRVEVLRQALQELISDTLRSEREHLLQIMQRRSFSSPMHYFDKEKQALDLLSMRLDGAFRRTLSVRQTKFSSLLSSLDAMNPLRVIQRGYAVVYKDDSVVTNTSAITVGDCIRVAMNGGSAVCSVDNILPE